MVSAGLCLIAALMPGRVIAASVQGSSITGPIKAEGWTIENRRATVDRHVEGELRIRYKQTASKESKTAFTHRHSLEEVRHFRRLGVHHVRIPKGADIAAYIERLRNEEQVEYVEPNYERKPMGTLPNDPVWAQQWGLAKIGLPDCWNYIKGSQGSIVAVIDTGVDYNHADLSGNMWNNPGEITGNLSDDDNNGYVDDAKGWNFYSNNNDPMDTQSHGTHVAGIIGAIGNNSIGVAGVNWRTRIMPVKFMGEYGGDVAAEIEAIEYAVDMGAKVINASYGGTSFSQTEYDASQDAGTKGVLFVAAAGNSGSSNDDQSFYPASCNLPNVISVAASDSGDSLAYFSNYGAASVHLAAPGVGILSTIPESQSTYPYGSKDGTSMAAPFVSGVAALIWAERPDATMSEVKQAILESVDTVPSLNGIVVTGGRLNAYKALQKIATFAQNQTNLMTGWNFVSFPRLPSASAAVETVLADISSSVVILWSYDNQAQKWLKWKPSDSASTLTSITADRGYWIYMSAPGTVNADGWLDVPQSIALYSGWNLISYGGASGKKVTSALGSISDSWNTIWSWDGGLWYGKDKTIPTLPAPIQPLLDMGMGKAYWIRMPPASGQIQWVQ
jgi:subtilisin family serine protease